MEVKRYCTILGRTETQYAMPVLRFPCSQMEGMKGRPCEEAPPLKSSYNPETSEGVDAETEVSKAEWATAMLTVGIPRAAALASFEAVVEELGGNQEATGEGSSILFCFLKDEFPRMESTERCQVLRLEDLACELNGMGGAAGVEELRGPVGKVKHGEVEIVDLGTPSEEVDFERDLARKTGLDGLVFDLHYNNHSPQDAFKHLPKAKLSALERNILGEMSEEELVEVRRTARIPCFCRLSVQEVRRFSWVPWF